MNMYTEWSKEKSEEKNERPYLLDIFCFASLFANWNYIRVFNIRTRMIISFIQQRFIKHTLCARYCATHCAETVPVFPGILITPAEKIEIN